MVSDINTRKADAPPLTPKTTGPFRRKGRRRRFLPRRFLLSSRLSQFILAANLIGLVILVMGSLAMNRFEEGLIQGKVDNLESLAATITTVLGEQATGTGQASVLDLESARQVLRGVNVPKDWRVRLHDRSGQTVLDTVQLDNRIEVGTLDPIVPAETEDATPDQSWLDTINSWVQRTLHNLPWREARRDRLRRDLNADVRAALAGTPMSGARYDEEDTLVVSATLPVSRVQQILGAVTVESRDVTGIVNAERRALAPIIGLALLMALLSSIALILFITVPMRRLAQAAERVTRNPQEYDSIPDLSHRRDEIGDLSLVMRDMTRGLFLRVDDIANFAADVAHEIKNPLTSLRSAADTLRVAKTDENREKLIAIIQQDVSRMSRLITDISDASKVDANLARDSVQILDAGEVVRNIVEFYQQTQVESAVQILDESDLDEPAFIRAFETPFAQVLRNLIDNAITFSPEGGTVRIKASVKAGRVLITVTDEGPGIPNDNLETVFDRFYTERPEGARFGSHSGLGLAICRQIVTAHKGRIWAENVVDEDGKRAGARFTVDLPQHVGDGASDGARRKRG